MLPDLCGGLLRESVLASSFSGLVCSNGQLDTSSGCSLSLDGKKTKKNDLNCGMLHELRRYCGGINPSKNELYTWPASVAGRWKTLNIIHKASHELGILSWNINGRMELRGCRESLLRR